MDIPGFALSADVELLRRECHNYKHSFGITDAIMHKLCVDESNPALEAAWDLIFYDSGIHSILRQEGVSKMSLCNTDRDQNLKKKMKISKFSL